MSRPTVVKLGGEVAGSPQLAALAGGLLRLQREGAQLALVHGGGPQLTALQKRLGIAVRQLAGRRFTDEETLGVLKLAVAGQVSVDLCRGLRLAGLQPVGLHGAVFARKRQPRAYPGSDAPIDLGLVGDVTGFDLPLLEALWHAGRVPVLACLGVGAGDESGALYNINADTVASALARALRAERLVLVSDVPVLRDRADPASCIPSLGAAEAQALIGSGAAQGGMIAKLEEACGALADGVAEVLITADLGPRTTVLRAAGR